jgi:hypothetical protein
MIVPVPTPPPQHMLISARAGADPAAAAHADQCAGATGAVQLVDGLRGEEAPGGAERVAERNRAAVGVDPLRVGLHRPGPCEHDRGEGFVDLEYVDVVNAQPGAGEHLFGGWDGAFQHQVRVAPDERALADPGQGRDTELPGPPRGHQQHGRGSVSDLRRRAGGVDAVLAGHRLQRGERLQ